MNFELSAEQKMLEEAVTKILREEISAERLRSSVYGEPAIDLPLWKELNNTGLTSVLLPESMGGAGLGLLEATLVFEQAGRAALPMPLLGHTLAALALRDSDTNHLSDDLRNGLLNGESIATCGFGGKDEDGRTRLDWVEFGSLADLLILVTDREVAVIDDKSRCRMEFADGTDLSRPCWHLQIENIDETMTLSTSPEKLTGAARILLAADSWGIGKFMLETAVEYAVTRKQFGRLIGEFQSIKHPLAELAVAHEFSRALLWQAANSFDAGEDDWREWALLCKAHITGLVVTMARQCIFSMGAMGFSWESDMHLWLKRALFNSIHLGTPLRLRQALAALRGWG